MGKGNRRVKDRVKGCGQVKGMQYVMYLWRIGEVEGEDREEKN